MHLEKVIPEANPESDGTVGWLVGRSVGLRPPQRGRPGWQVGRSLGQLRRGLAPPGLAGGTNFLFFFNRICRASPRKAMHNHLDISSKKLISNKKNIKFNPNFDFGHVLCVFRPDSDGCPQSEFSRIRTAVPNLSSVGFGRPSQI